MTADAAQEERVGVYVGLWDALAADDTPAAVAVRMLLEDAVAGVDTPVVIGQPNEGV